MFSYYGPKYIKTDTDLMLKTYFYYRYHTTRVSFIWFSLYETEIQKKVIYLNGI